jgi:hypothetical protein
VVGTIYVLAEGMGLIAVLADMGAASYITNLGVATTTSRIELRINASGVQM